VAGVARGGEAVSAGADSGGGGVASSFDGERGGSLLAGGAGAAESGGVSGGVWGNSAGSIVGVAGAMASGTAGGWSYARPSADCSGRVRWSSSDRTAAGGCPHINPASHFLIEIPGR